MKVNSGSEVFPSKSIDFTVGWGLTLSHAKETGLMALNGTVVLPGDKSISHRALMLACLADGLSTLRNVNRGADVRQTAKLLKRCGIDVVREGDTVRIQGAGNEPFLQPQLPLDCGNSGTTARLGMGLLAGYPLQITFIGDDSLSQRPMNRVIIPLRQMGVRISTRDQGYLPIMLTGGDLWGIHYDLPVASAQVKSAILLAGLNAQSKTTLSSPLPSRDHTERMLKVLGVSLKTDHSLITLQPLKKPLQTQDFTIPGDISAGAFLIAAATLIPDSEILLTGVGLNPTRTGFLDVLKKMNGQLTITPTGETVGEPGGEVVIQSADLYGVTIGPELVPNVIDELPLIALLATQAEGETVVTGAAELRVKESDRIKAIVQNLRNWGAHIEDRPDGFGVHGPTRLKGGKVETFHDHRIAMMMSVAGLIADSPAWLDDEQCLDISFPGFLAVLKKLHRT